MARLRKTVSRGPRVREVASAVKTASKTPLQQGTDYLFYAVPPVILLLIFFICAKNARPLPVETTTTASGVVVRTEKEKNIAIAEALKPTLVIPADVNNDLPAYEIPAGQQNVLADGKAQASQSGYARKFPAQRSLDGSIQNDDQVSIAEATGGRPAWWQADLAGNGAAVSSIVIYGAGSASPAGKLLGGFEVSLEDVNGEVQTRLFNELGFALEGHEVWKLESPVELKTIRINSLNRRSPIVLREVLAISPQP